MATTGTYILNAPCRMFTRTDKIRFPFRIFPIAFSDCSSNLVACRHLISLLSLFQRHVARRNLFYQGLKKRKEGLLKIQRKRNSVLSIFIFLAFLVPCSALFSIELGHFVDRKTMIVCFLNIKNLSKEPTRVSRDF